MKIVVLDGYTLNPGDIAWDALHSLGDVTIYDRTDSDQVISRSKGAQIVLTNKVVINKNILDSLADLKYIGVLATGYNVVDTEEARKRGITVTNIPAYSTDAVVQMVFAHILNIYNQVAHYSLEVRNGKWSASKEFCFTDNTLLELHGKKMEIRV